MAQIASQSDAIVMDERDHVATLLKEVKAGTAVRIGKSDESIVALADIPFGHKIAIQDIEAGSEVRKYGEVIGQSTVFIAKGEHVHVHNVEGIRGRGDKAVSKTGGGEA